MNFEDTDFRQEILDIESPYDVKLVSNFLSDLDFDFKPSEVDCTMILYNLNDEIVGTGSYKNKTLKYIAVSPQFRDSTAFALIVTHLSNIILQSNRTCFVFTKPNTAKLFESLGFSIIPTAEPLFSVLEFGLASIKNYQNYLSLIKKETKTDNISAIVVNCNPFTNGHKYLIERASSESELVYLFVVEENLSAFPFEIRWELIKKGISHLNNVVMVKAGEYIVSGSIFPNYFLKNESFDLVSQKQAEIDVAIFTDYFVPILGIKKRYIGTENYCKTTCAYNNAMFKILPKANVDVIEVTRKSLGMTEKNEPNYISASKVREAIKNNKIEDVLEFIPETTRDFLLSENAKGILDKIKRSKGRH